MTYHPGIVISNDELYEAEGFFYCVMMSTKNYHPEYIFEITKDMVSKPGGKFPSYAKCQIINNFTEKDIEKRFGMIKQEAFKKLIVKIKQSIF